MPTRESKKKDFSQIAVEVVESATKSDLSRKAKNPFAVALGKLGASKGGIARAKKLSSKKRREIAQKAAQVRWKKKR